MRALKWVLIVLAILFIIGILADVDHTDASDAPNSPHTQSADQQSDPNEDFRNRLARETSELESFDVREHLDSREAIIIAAALFSAHAQLVADGESMELEADDAAALDTFRRRLVQQQRQVFPTLRDAYGPIMRQALWEHDMSSRTFGSGFRTIEIVGAPFAANRNIKAFHEASAELLMQLRFERAQYKWIESDRRFTYFTLNGPKDDDLVIWSRGGYRLIE